MTMTFISLLLGSLLVTPTPRVASDVILPRPLYYEAGRSVVAFPLPLQSCDQTFSSTTGLATAITNAANGSTICLDNGTYTLNLTNIARSGFVTVRSTSGTGAIWAASNFSNVDFIKFESMQWRDIEITNCSTNVQLLNGSFVSGQPGLFINYGGAGCSAGQGLLVHNVTFSAVTMATFEGRLSTNGTTLDGLTVSGSFFGNGGIADGIQVGGGTNLVFGPDNIFDGVNQDVCGATHCDAFQAYCGEPDGDECVGGIIRRNWFKNNDTDIMMPDGSQNWIVEDNIFDDNSSDYESPIQFGAAVNLMFRHNTVRCLPADEFNDCVNFDSKGAGVPTSGTIENNIFHGADLDLEGGDGCTPCTIRFNLFSVSAFQRGTNVVIGTPTYVGGANPSTLAGWALAGGSAGKNAGNDGLDMGSRYFGAADPTGGGSRLRIRQ